jgi:hypothetical protein
LAPDVERRSPPGLNYLFDCDVRTERPLLMDTPFGSRMSVVVTGGSVDGPALTGRILPGGGDWGLRGTSDLARVEMRMTMATDNGELVLCDATGVIDMPDDAFERLHAGERLTADEVYFRVTPSFETGAPSLAWLNRVAAIGVGALAPTGALFQIFQVL